MTQTEIYVVLTEIFYDVFLREIELKPSMTAKDIADWDSFKQIEIIMATEERFSIKLSTREADGLKNVGDLAGVIAGKVGTS
jgi:acyl carrier protein